MLTDDATTENGLLTPSMKLKRNIIMRDFEDEVESLYGSGYNIYYAFLIKCQRFIDLFGKEKFTPMLVREREDMEV